MIEKHSRWSLYPIQHQDLWGMYKKHVACFWTVEEVDLSRDFQDFTQKLNEEERTFIKQILAFFAFGDGMVMENIMTRFFDQVEIAEARQFYAVQTFMEAIHAEMYALLLQTLVRDEKEKRRLFDLTQTHPALQKKAEWMMKWMNDQEYSLADRMAAYACVEGIFFSSSFAALFWLKTRNICHGLTFSNELISRDEGLHRDFALMLWTKLADADYDRVLEIVQSSVDVEIDFMRSALDVKVMGLCVDDMVLYVKFVADNLLVALGGTPFYKASNPFPFMDLISIEGKTNFFERRVSEYALSGVMTEDKKFCLDEVF